MVHRFGQLRGSNYRCGGHGIRSDWPLLTRNTLRVFESRAFHSSPPLDTMSYVIAGFIATRRG